MSPQYNSVYMFASLTSKKIAKPDIESILRVVYFDKEIQVLSFPKLIIVNK